VSYVWFTTDAASGVTAARAEVISSQTLTATLEDAMNFHFPEINRIWAVPDAGDVFRAPVAPSTPTLFVVGTLDGITPLPQTREIMQRFSQVDCCSSRTVVIIRSSARVKSPRRSLAEEQTRMIDFYEAIVDTLRAQTRRVATDWQFEIDANIISATTFVPLESLQCQSAKK